MKAKVDKGSLARNALVTSNDLDIRLYKFIERLFLEQEETIELYESSIATSNAESAQADGSEEHDLEEEGEEGEGGEKPQELTTGLEEETVSVESGTEEEIMLEEPAPKDVVPEEHSDPKPAHSHSVEPEPLESDSIESEPIESDPPVTKWKWLWSRS